MTSRVLLAVGASCDSGETSDYLAARFDGTAVEVDVLSVVPVPRSPVDRLYIAGREAAERAAATEVVTSIAQRLGERHGFRLVRTHVQRGVTPDVILAASERWRSATVLIGAPREPDLLTTLGFDSVAQAVATRARCPVEVLRPVSLGPDGEHRVLAVVDVSRLADFPFDQLRLQSLSWRGRGLLRILGVLPPAAGVARAWATAAGARSRVDWAKARLEALCRALTVSSEGRVAADHRLIEGNVGRVALASAKRLAASLLVLDGAAADDGLRGLFSRLSSFAVTTAAPCAVLLLHAGERSRVPVAEAASLGVVTDPSGRALPGGRSTHRAR